MKEPHTALFVAPTRVGKIHLALNLLEKEYQNHFDFIIILVHYNFCTYNSCTFQYDFVKTQRNVQESKMGLD